MIKVWSLFVCFACQSAALAQDSAAHSFRILPVGDPPPFIQEVRDGVRYEVPPRKGSLPPRELKGPLVGQESPEQVQLIQPRLGRITSPFFLPAVDEKKRVSLFYDDGKRWLDLGTRAGGTSLLLTWRAGSDWNQAAYLEIPQERLNAQAASVHFANLTSIPIAIIFGEERIRLDSGKFFTRSVQVNAPPVPLEIFTTDTDGKLISIFSNQIEPIAPSFRVVAIYVADGNRPRTPIKVLSVEELL